MPFRVWLQGDNCMGLGGSPPFLPLPTLFFFFLFKSSVVKSIFKVQFVPKGL